MNTKSQKTLEFPKIVQMLADRAVSQAGKRLALELSPETDIHVVTRALQATTESSAIIVKRGSLPLGGIRDISDSLTRARLGGVLSVEELVAVADFAYVTRKAQSYFKEGARQTDGEQFPIVADLFGLLVPAGDLESEIGRCVSPPNLVNDGASSRLAAIRRQIKSAGDKIRESLNKIIHSGDYKSMLQDNVITIRNDRYVVPIKQEHRGNFPGMIHDQSSSGSTLFIEPAGVVQMNNKIKELLADEKIEIHNILRELSALVAAKADVLAANLDALTRLDFIFAKGELSLQMRASEPQFNTRGEVDIKKGRHPLLPADKVVPTDIYIGKDFTTLLITGPNTGGKTVALKTLGLFTLMGQAGLHIPAFDNSSLALFDNVFADIGDEQSIEQNLSTFSSHMSNIVKILEDISDNSLVLLDELGAGTDPTEGAALAIAIIDKLTRRGIRTAVTTHYSELKVFALKEGGVQNASCEFDVETLRPTYKLLIGIPGKSNAFAISSKLGLPAEIIEAARERISSTNIKFEDVLTDLEISRKSMEIEKERAEQYRLEAQRLREDVESQKAKLAASREKQLQAAREEARRVVADAKDEADALMKELRKSLSRATPQNPHESDAARQKVGDLLRRHDSIRQEQAAGAPAKPKEPPTTLRKGDSVFIHTLSQNGIVSEPPDQHGEVLVSAGIMKIKVHLTNLSLNEETSVQHKHTPAFAAPAKQSKSMSVSHEINLLGCLAAEAVEKADKFMDDTYLSGLSQARLIHGKGTGALRNAIHNHLRNHPLVKSYRLGGQGEGDAGVTIVEFKK
ncbi:MAG: endonuclease MutS2 [Defluviitaleaceae bacterium]|nr:endonuclease MutS2 [Defluviitaleaceae bacterium]